MFDPCRKWRRRSALREEGRLPVAQWGALEDHLACCSHCRALEDTDLTLREALRVSYRLPEDEAEAFDQRVLAEWRTAAPLPVAKRRFRLPGFRRLQGLPVQFFRQAVGGALVAASVTVLCLSFSLHAPGNSAKPTHAPANAPLAAQNDPPVPLETLLRTPKPRAALLWQAPGRKEKTAPPKSDGLDRLERSDRSQRRPNRPEQRDKRGDDARLDARLQS